MDKMKSIPLKILFTGCLMSLAGQLSAQETLAYNQRFVNTTGSNAPWSTLDGWKGYTTDLQDNDPDNVLVRVAAGEDTTQDGIPSTPGSIGGNVSGGVGTEISFDDNDFGYLWLYRFDPGDLSCIVFNDTVPIDRDEQEITRITFAMRDRSNAQHSGHVAVKVGGQWYVNELLFVTELTDTIQYNMREFTWTTQGWKKVIFDETNFQEELAISSDPAMDLPSGDLEGFGFYYNVTGGGVSSAVLDEYSVYVAPATSNGWYGYSVDEQGWADTETWLGWVNVTSDPYIWTLDLSKYIYVGDDSGWAYVPK
jgi:hypothetical protein